MASSASADPLNSNTSNEPENSWSWLEEQCICYDSSDSDAEQVYDYLNSDTYYGTDTSEAYSSDEDSENTSNPNLENETLQSHQDYIYGRNKYKWLKTAPSQATASQHTIQCEPTTNLSGDGVDFITIWKKLIDDEILQEILRWTNVKLKKARDAANGSEHDLELHELDITELLGLIGVIVYSAYFGLNKEDADSIFEGMFARDIFKCVMPKDRFINLLKYIRFEYQDEKETRPKYDKFAAISSIFQRFVNNCQNLYSPGQYVSVGEALIPFKDPPCITLHRRRCSKRGFQIKCLCDAKNGYFFNGYIHKETDSESEGMMEDEKKYSIPTRTILRLSRPLYGSYRNVTCDKPYTSIELIEALNKNGMSCVGLVSKSLKELPLRFLPSRTRARGSTLYAFTDQITLASYVPRKNKALTVASSMHHDENKSEMIDCLVSTIQGVSRIDSKRSVFSCARYTRRGALAIFFWILDISLINTHIAFNVYHGTKFKREKFMRTLAHCLVLQQLQRRVFDQRLPVELRGKMRMVLGADMPLAPKSNKTETEVLLSVP